MTAMGFGAADKVAKAGDTMTGTLVLDGSTPLQIPAGAASGDVLTSDSSGHAAWAAPPTSATTVDGVAVSGTPSSGQVLTATSPTAADWQTPTAGNIIDGITVTGTPSPGMLLTATSTSAADWQSPASGAGVTLDSTATDIQALGTRAAGSTGQAADAGHVHPATGVATIDATGTDIAALGVQAAGSVGKAADAGHVHPTTGVALLAGANFTGAVSPAVAALTDGSSIAINAALGNVFTVTIAGNRTLANPTNLVDGQRIIIAVKQDGTGSRLLSYGTVYAFSAALPAPTLSTAAAATDYFGFIYSAAATKLRLLAFLGGF